MNYNIFLIVIYNYISILEIKKIQSFEYITYFEYIVMYYVS